MKLIAFPEPSGSQPYTQPHSLLQQNRMPLGSMKRMQSGQISVETLYLRLVNSYSSFTSQELTSGTFSDTHLPSPTERVILSSVLPLSLRNTVGFLKNHHPLSLLFKVFEQMTKSLSPFPCPHFSPPFSRLFYIGDVFLKICTSRNV